MLLGMAGTEHHTAVIFRREFPQCRAMIERSREIYNSIGLNRSKDSYNESLHRWMLHDGKMVEFGAMEHEKDKENWRGRPHDFYGFDEVTQFTESQYLFVTAWLRTVLHGQRCRVVATGNPPTSSEGFWVMRRWRAWMPGQQHPKPANAGELRWYARIEGEDTEIPLELKEPFRSQFIESGQDPSQPFKYTNKEGVTSIIRPSSRTFIPARLADNSILDADGAYRTKLEGMPEPLRSQMLYGDFSIGLVDGAWQVIPSAWVRAAMKRWTPDGGKDIPLSALGVDPNYGGTDKMCISARRGSWFAPIKKYQGKQAMPGHVGEGDANAALIVLEYEVRAAINLDVIGWGAATYEALKRYEYIAKSSQINPVNSAHGLSVFDSTGRLPLPNVRSALWWKMREALDPVNGENLALPPDPELEGDLCSATYQLKPNGIIIEEKKKIKERIGRSPDAGEALMLAHWYRSGHPSVPDPDLMRNVKADPSDAVNPMRQDRLSFDDDEEDQSSNWSRRMRR